MKFHEFRIFNVELFASGNPSYGEIEFKYQDADGLYQAVRIRTWIKSDERTTIESAKPAFVEAAKEVLRAALRDLEAKGAEQLLNEKSQIFPDSFDNIPSD